MFHTKNTGRNMVHTVRLVSRKTQVQHVQTVKKCSTQLKHVPHKKHRSQHGPHSETCLQKNTGATCPHSKKVFHTEKKSSTQKKKVETWSTQLNLYPKKNRCNMSTQ